MQNINLKACSKCHRLFKTTSDSDICSECNIILEKIYRNVKIYIRNNKLAGLMEVSEECNVSVKQLLKWIREERLLFTEGSGVGIPCLNCGVTIRSGKYCVPCLKKMTKTLASTYAGPVKSDDSDTLVTQKNKMHSKRGIHRSF